MLNPTIPSRRIGFVSTRFSTNDGVSLETQKWAHVLEGLGHQLFYFAGLCDRPPEVSYVVPEAHFDHPEIRELNEHGIWPAGTPLPCNAQNARAAMGHQAAPL